MTTYSSFLIRCWRGGADGATRRFTAEHSQTGQQYQAASLDEICRWIEAVNDRLPTSNADDGEIERDEQ